MRPVADSDTLEVGALRQLLGDLGKEVWECCCRLDSQSELALFANKP
jgi:hypothetical protein